MSALDRTRAQIIAGREQIEQANTAEVSDRLGEIDMPGLYTKFEVVCSLAITIGTQIAMLSSQARFAKTDITEGAGMLSEAARGAETAEALELGTAPGTLIVHSTQQEKNVSGLAAEVPVVNELLARAKAHIGEMTGLYAVAMASDVIIADVCPQVVELTDNFLQTLTGEEEG